jgi:hypothetical protein
MISKKLLLFAFFTITSFFSIQLAEEAEHKHKDIPSWLKKLQEKGDTSCSSKMDFFRKHLKNKFGGEILWKRIKAQLTEEEFKDLVGDVSVYWERKNKKWVTYKSNNDMIMIGYWRIAGGLLLISTAIAGLVDSSPNKPGPKALTALGSSGIICFGDFYRHYQNYNQKYEHFDAVNHHHKILENLASQKSSQKN